MEQVLNQIISQVLPVIITAIIGILVAIIKSVGNAAVNFIEAKKQAIAIQMGTDKYNQQLAFAKSIYSIVEEYFRLNEVVGDKVAQKQEMFDKLLLEKIPYLTQEDIIHLRQAIVGKANEGKEVIVTPATSTVVDTNVNPVSKETQDTIAEFHNDNQ